MPSKVTYEISITYRKETFATRERVICLFKQCGVDESEIVECVEKGQVRISFFRRDRSAAYALRKKILRSSARGLRVRVVSLQDIEWQTKWKSDYKPFGLTQKIRVVPYELRDVTCPGRRHDLYIDTNTVFGTGTHPTTQCMAEFLAKKARRFRRVLDIGTGTGILSAVAHVYGARDLWGVDISRDAVATARKNLRYNGLRFNTLLSMDFREFSYRQTFDFVLANVITAELIRMRRKIIARVRPGKYLAVSGVSLSHFREFRQKFEMPRLRCLQIKERDGWMAVLYKKKACM